MTDPEQTPARLRALVEKWRATRDSVIRTKWTAFEACANDLDALLVREVPPVEARQSVGEWTDAQIGRLIDQSQHISRMLSEAGIGASTLVEGVRELVHRPRGACHTHGDPLVCLACEAEENARPEWRLDLEPFKAFARTHRFPQRDPFAEQLAAAVLTLVAEIERLRASAASPASVEAAAPRDQEARPTTGDVIEAAAHLEAELREHVPTFPRASYVVRDVLEKHLRKALFAACGAASKEPTHDDRHE